MLFVKDDSRLELTENLIGKSTSSDPQKLI